MRVIITRHGKAEYDSVTGLDRDRQLRRRGEAQADFLGMTLATLDEPPTRLICSPYARARQTAERINRVLGLEMSCEDRLACGSGIAELLDVICEHRDNGTICLVGHNPTCDCAVAALVDGAGGRPLGHRTGEAVVLEVDPDDPIGSGRVVARIRLEQG